jgi:hypothetical protein
MLRYYARGRTYRVVGPPVLPLRILGPFVVLATLALLGSGPILIALGEQPSRSSAIPLLGDWVSFHQAMFVVFDVVAGLHLLARIAPALMLVSGRRKENPGAAGPVPGRAARVAVLGAGPASRLRLEPRRLRPVRQAAGRVGAPLRDQASGSPGCAGVTLTALGVRNVIAIDQDPLGVQAHLV